MPGGMPGGEYRGHSDENLYKILLDPVCKLGGLYVLHRHQSEGMS